MNKKEYFKKLREGNSMLVDFYYWLGKLNKRKTKIQLNKSRRYKNGKENPKES